MTTLASLPYEIIETIVCCSDISIEDIINFRYVCKKFRNAAKAEKYCFRKKKFFQRWPSAKKYYDEQFKKNEQQKSKKNEQKEYLNFIEKGIDCLKQLRNYMSLTTFKHDLRFNHSDAMFRIKSFLAEDLNPLKEVTCKTENNIKILFFIDEIEQLLLQPPRVGCELIERYWYTRLFDYLRTYWRESILKTFEERPHKELLEESATILAQQLQPGKNVFYSSVKGSLNTIALQALNYIKGKHPAHSIFSEHVDYFSYLRNNNIDNNSWSKAEETQIMETLEEYMSKKLKFKSTELNNLQCMCIDYVLEKKYGHELIVNIIYESVARRLGLRWAVVAKPLIDSVFCFVVMWFPNYELQRRYEMDEDYEDILRYEKSMKCFRVVVDRFPSAYKLELGIDQICRQTFAEMLKTILQTENELLPIIPSYQYVLTVYDVLERRTPETRPQRIKFAVGMIVTHGDQSTDCSTGVIIGWHQHKCDFDIQQYITGLVMPLKICGNFSITKQKTYYIILTKNDELCYAKEDDITLTKPIWIENKNIYRYFCKFENTHYVPNEMLAKVYPHDAAITAGTIFKN